VALVCQYDIVVDGSLVMVWCAYSGGQPGREGGAVGGAVGAGAVAISDREGTVRGQAQPSGALLGVRLGAALQV